MESRLLNAHFLSTNLIGQHYEDAMKHAVIFVIKDILGADHLVNTENILRQACMGPRRYKIDWAYQYENKLIIFECKFRNTRGCNEKEIGEFWRWCYAIQGFYADLEVHGIVLTNTFYEQGAIIWASKWPYSALHNRHLRLYTVNVSKGQTYCILVSNMSISLNNLNYKILSSFDYRDKPDILGKDCSFDDMILVGLNNIDVDIFSKIISRRVYLLSKEFKYLEILTNALLHKNFINECIAFSAYVSQNIEEVLRLNEGKPSISSILEIYAAYWSAIRMRTIKRYNKPPSNAQIKQLLRLTDYFASKKNPPGAIATLARLASLSLARHGNKLRCLELFDISRKIIDNQPSEDHFLEKTTKLTIAQTYLDLKKNYEIVEKILQNSEKDIESFLSERHRIMAKQKYLSLCLNKFKLLGLNKEYLETREKLYKFQALHGLGIWM